MQGSPYSPSTLQGYCRAQEDYYLLGLFCELVAIGFCAGFKFREEKFAYPYQVPPKVLRGENDFACFFQEILFSTTLMGLFGKGSLQKIFREFP